ncbi:kinase-like domain-containing protein, partial [Pterulicium gracile]
MPRRPLRPFFQRPCLARDKPPLTRFYSIQGQPQSDLFEYTSGRWIFDEPLRLKEHRTTFDVDGLCQLAAKSVNRPSSDVAGISKFAEGGFNRLLQITMTDGFKLIARIPYPLFAPRGLCLACEVATMDFVRQHTAVPVPTVYSYDPTREKEAGTEYMFMELVDGVPLSEAMPEFDDMDEYAEVIRQMVEVEAAVMQLKFPAAGGLYYAEDLERLSSSVRGVPVKSNEGRFCIGPNTQADWWMGKRSQLDFSTPMHPRNRARRPFYNFEKQSPQEHIENLKRYLLLAPSLVPKNVYTNRPAFVLRHPSYRPINILLAGSSDSNLRTQIVSVLDCEQSSICPPFLDVGLPNDIQNYGDPVCDTLVPPELPDISDSTSPEDLTKFGTYLWRFLHHQYATQSIALMGPESLFTNQLSISRMSLFQSARHVWEGETIPLLQREVARLVSDWTEIVGPDSGPCPVVMTDKEVQDTFEFSHKVEEVDAKFLRLCNALGTRSDGFVLENSEVEDAVV